MEHPYFAVTKADGAFEIPGLVDGEFTVAAWHEKLGTIEKKIKVAAAEPATLEGRVQEVEALASAPAVGREAERAEQQRHVVVLRAIAHREDDLTSG